MLNGRRLRAPDLPTLIVVLAIAVVIGGVVRVRVLQDIMMSTWRKVLVGGEVTTRATLDDWFGARVIDAEVLASTIAMHASLERGRTAATESRFDPLASLDRHGKYLDLFIVDARGRVLSSAHGDSVTDTEHDAVRAAITEQRTTLSRVTVLGRHAAQVSIVSPTFPGRSVARPGSPAAVVLRVDAVRAFTPWATGRANAALSRFVAPASEGVVVVSVCPDENPPVCVEAYPRLPAGTPVAFAYAGVDTFGVFPGLKGVPLFAATGVSRGLGWGVIRSIRRSDAIVPLRNEILIEGGFLAAFLVIVSLGAVALNRTRRVVRLTETRDAMRLLAIVVDASTDGIISFNERHEITMVNAAVERMLGYSRARLVDMPVLQLFADEFHARLQRTFASIDESEADSPSQGATERCIALTFDGMAVPVDARVGRTVTDGESLFVMGLRDMSERARTERFLQGQRHVLELIASGAPLIETMTELARVAEGELPEVRCAVYEMDDERQMARLVAAPSLLPEFFEATREIAIGSREPSVGTAIHRNDVVSWTDIANDSGWRDLRDLAASHGLRAGWAMPLRAADDRVIGALAWYLAEPRERTVREEELAIAAVQVASIALSSARDAALLRASEASFRSFVENAPAAIFRETRGGHLISWNQAMIGLLGYPDAVALGHAVERGELYRDAGARATLVRHLEEGDVVRGFELEWQRADKSVLTVRLSARAYRDDFGDVWMWEGYAEDVTSLRAAEHALRRNERLAAVGQLISGVAHELNNPLSSILHFTEDLLADERPPADFEALGVIRDQARRSRSIVRDLLSFVRKRTVSTEPMSLGEVVAATARALRRTLDTTGVSLHLKIDADPSVVLADRAGMEQIVTNLVSNAAQACGPGGRIWVHTSRVGSLCRLVVEDSGPGIPPEILPLIFDPFFTTKPMGEGTGLGLSVTLGIVEQFGGRIAVDSRDDGPGSRFTVQFPAMDSDSAPKAAAPDAATAAPAAGTVPASSPSDTPRAGPDVERNVALIIDDEPTIRSALRRYFARRGWQVEEAADGASGLKRLDEMADRIGIVLSDLRMPGFSGIELHDELALSQPALLRRFVFSTGDVASAEAANFVQRTSCPVLQKPFELRMLDEIIAIVTDGATGGRVVP